MSELAPVQASIVEQVVIGGDLSKLSDEQRVAYYKSVCDSLGLNPLTRPFDYIVLNGKLTLYAKRDAADQLRKLHGISIDKPDVTIEDGLVMVAVTGHDNSGRADSDLGVVSIGNLQGANKANAIMKAITKAKRRLTLSIVGLGWLDETEIESIPGAEPAQLGEAESENPDIHWIDAVDAQGREIRVRFWQWARDTMGLKDAEVYTALGVEHIHDFTGTMAEAKTKIEAWTGHQADLEEAEREGAE